MFMQQLEIDAVNIVVSHAHTPSYATAVDQKAVKITAAAPVEDRKRSAYLRDMRGRAAIRFDPFAADSCGRMGRAAVKFVSDWAALRRRVDASPRG